MSSDNYVIGTNCGINLGLSSWCVLIGDDILGEKDRDHQFVIKTGIPTISADQMHTFLEYYYDHYEIAKKYGEEKAKLIREKLSEMKESYHQKLSAVEFIHTYKETRTHRFRIVRREPVILNLLAGHLPVADVPELVLQYLAGDWCLEHCTSIDMLPVYRDEQRNTYLDSSRTVLHSVDDKPAKTLDNCQHWYRNGKLHREGDRPAIIDGPVNIWFQWGHVHRDDDKPTLTTNRQSVWSSEERIHRYKHPAMMIDNDIQIPVEYGGAIMDLYVLGMLMT